MKGFPSPAWTAVATAVVALVVFQTLRGCWLERYVVSSGSMEPLLAGDPDSGDRVLVDKSVGASWVPARGDLVVMRDPEDPDSYLIKRVVARGGERVQLMRGDVFLWDPDRGDWRRWEKHPLDFADMRMTFFERPGEGEEPRAGFMSGPEGFEGVGGRLPPAADSLAELRDSLLPETRSARRQATPAGPVPPGHVGLAPVDARFLDSRGHLRGEALPCQDIGLELELVPETGLRGLQLVFGFHDELYSWTYAADGSVRFHVAGEPQGEPVAGDPLRAGEPFRVEFGHLDGSFFLAAGGCLLGQWPRELPLFGSPALPPDLGRVPANGLYFAPAGAAARITRLRVFHDVYYQALDRPFQARDVTVPEGELWLLGDNTFDSRDSRSRGGFPRDRLVGRPVAILGPRSRFRLLSR